MAWSDGFRTPSRGRRRSDSLDLSYPAYFSRRTPLNFFAAVFFLAGFFTAMNSPDFLFRLVQTLAPPSFVLTCERFLTAPLRALSPTGLLTASDLQLSAGDKDLYINRFPERIRHRQLESRFCCVGVTAMRRSNWTPSIVRNGNDQTVYLVADDFGKNGAAWRETDYEAADLETVIQGLLAGEYHHPIRVVAFNTVEGWSEDVSEDVALELRRRCDLQMRDIPAGLQDFTDRYEGRYRDVQLPLPMRLV